jgi:DNA invertase Pin-like site-specific DNA recombinase
LKLLKARRVGLYLRDLAGDATRDSTSELLFGIMASLGSWERRRLSERRASVRQDQQDAGRYMGGATPFGHVIVERDGKQFAEPLPTVMDEARRLRDQGYSARLAAGHFTGMGHPCTHKTIARLWRDMAA